MSEIGNVELGPAGDKRTLVYENETGLKVYEQLSYPTGKQSLLEMTPGHFYRVVWEDMHGNPHGQAVSFQDGPIPANGVNGVTNEAMLAILIHRTETLNAQFPCDENELAILHMKKALAAFDARTAKRKARGVEGKNVV